MKEESKTYRICYRMECTVEATSEDEAMEKYGEGEGESHEYVEFMSIECFDEQDAVDEQISK